MDIRSLPALAFPSPSLPAPAAPSGGPAPGETFTRSGPDPDFPEGRLARLFHRPDPERSHRISRGIGQELLEGRMTRKDLLRESKLLPQRLEAALGASTLPVASRKWVEAHAVHDPEEGDLRLPLDSIEDLLVSAGRLTLTGEGTVAIDYEHHFDMDYAPGGGFRGSRSYEAPGRTEMASIRVWQGPAGPAVVVVDSVAPGHAGPRVEGTDHDGESSSQSVYLVDDLSKIVGATGNTVDGDGPVKDRLEKLFQSLQANSQVEFRNFAMGYGRVGTSYYSKMRVGAVEVSDHDGLALRAASASVGLHLVEGRFGRTAPPAAPPSPPSALRYVLPGAVGGAIFAGVGVAAGLGPVGLATGVVLTAGATALGAALLSRG